MATAIVEPPDRVVLTPHTGPQTGFLSNPADICIGGGARGGGKTFCLLAEPTRNIRVPGFDTVLFRRTYAQLEATGGPWPESQKLYPHIGGVSVGHRWLFRTRDERRPAIVQMSHLQHEKDLQGWLGAQIALILYDQLEGFTESQFWSMLGCNRTMCGVRPYIRATCNPVPEDDKTGGWLRRLLDWWIDKEKGYAIPERAGRVRYFARINEQIHWGETKQELAERFRTVKGVKPMSLSFVPMGLDDNPSMAQADPDYEAKLLALPYVERMRWRWGNWNVRDTGAGKFKRTWFKVLESKPTDGTVRWLRFWDCAATEDGGDETAGALVGITDEKPQRIIIADIKAGHWRPGEVEQRILQQAAIDGRMVTVREEMEPGSSGKAVVEARANRLMGYDYGGIKSSNDKLTRWKPLIAQAENGYVYIVRGEWNEPFLSQAETADGTDRTGDDQVDAVCGAFLRLAAGEGLRGGGPIRISGW